MHKFRHVLIERETRPGGDIARLILNRPQKLNAMSTPLNRELRAAAEALAADEDLRAVVLTGAGGRAFVGGADIDEMVGMDAAAARAFITELHLAIHAVRMLPMPVIGRIEGYCLGAGLELAAVCDLRVASDDARLGMPEVRVGMPSVIEAALLPRLMGWGNAAEILLTGELMDAGAAHRCGLVQRVATRAKLDDQVEAWLSAILDSAPGAVRLQKRLLQQWERLPLDAAIRASIDIFEESHHGPEPQARLARFRKTR